MLESFWVGFSDLFVLHTHGVSPSGRAVWPCFCAVAAAAAEAAAAANFLQVLCSVSRVSDVTLQSFPCGCVFVPLQWQQKHQQQQQQQLIFRKFSVLFLGFQSDVREFLGGILGFVRPSGPWCFPVRQGRVAVFLCSRSSRSSSSSSQFFASFLFCFQGFQT